MKRNSWSWKREAVGTVAVCLFLCFASVAIPRCAMPQPGQPGYDEGRARVQAIINVTTEIGLDIAAIKYAETDEQKRAAEDELARDLKALVPKLPPQYAWAAEIKQIADEYERHRRMSGSKWIAALQALNEWSKQPWAGPDVMAMPAPAP